MIVAEFLEAISELIDSRLRRANDHAEEALLKEALRGESQTILLRQQHLAELDVVADAVEFVELDAHHHVHGSAAPDRRYTSDLRETQESCLTGGCQFLFHRLKVAVGHLFQNAWQCKLHERVWMQLDHRVHVHARQHIVEVALIVVHDGPAASPAWQAVDLGDSTSADDWHSLGRLSD